MIDKLPVTVLIAAKDEEANIARCLSSLSPAARILVVDSNSKDRTARISRGMGAEVFEFHYSGTYPKKRQWALDHIPIGTEWILLLDADEAVPEKLWREISDTIRRNGAADAYLIKKEFHFLGRRFRFGGFSHAAVLLFRKGKAEFERLSSLPGDSQDMEVHERLIIHGATGKLKTGILHEDAKGLQAYIARHNHYSTWEAHQRRHYLTTGSWGELSIRPRLFGDTQQRRRFFKGWMIHIPFEASLWFVYHFFLRIGFLEGRRGLIASQIRARHFSQVRAKLFEIQVEDRLRVDSGNKTMQAIERDAPVAHEEIPHPNSPW